MKRELGIARCGLACCLCSENDKCEGCNSGGCPGFQDCENRLCSLQKGLDHCYECKEQCRKALLSKIKPYGFNLFIKQFGEEELLNCLERNEKNGDYDYFDDVQELIAFIRTGKK